MSCQGSAIQSVILFKEQENSDETQNSTHASNIITATSQMPQNQFIVTPSDFASENGQSAPITTTAGFQSLSQFITHGNQIIPVTSNQRTDDTFTFYIPKEEGNMVPITTDIDNAIPLTTDGSNLVAITTNDIKVIPITTDDGNIVSFSGVNDVFNITTGIGKMIPRTTVPITTNLGNIVHISNDDGHLVPLTTISSHIVPTTPNDGNVVTINTNGGNLPPITRIGDNIAPVTTKNNFIVTTIPDNLQMFSTATYSSDIEPFTDTINEHS